MATIFRRPGRPFWYAEYRDQTGRKRQRCTKTTDYEDAQLVADKLQTAAALRRRGIIDARADACARAARVPIREHLADFLAGVRARGVSEQQAQQLDTRIKRVLKLAGIDSTAGISSHAVAKAVADVQTGDEDHRPVSVQTAIHYVRAVKQFTRWLVQESRLASDPLVGIGAMGNPETDRKRTRREHLDDELARLVDAAEHGPTIRKVSGTDRALLYRLAVGTGFRAGELKSLTPESFDLNAEPPTVTVHAAYSKHRKTDVQPIRPELADLVADWLVTKPAGRRVFSFKCKTAYLIRADLAAARAAWLADARTDSERTERQQSGFLTYLDAAGEAADFHALRHTYISRLVAGGASVKTCQELARHSNPLLTIGRYSHVRLADLTGALQALPCPAPNDRPEPQAMRATGTYHERPADAVNDPTVEIGRSKLDRFGTKAHRSSTDAHGAHAISKQKRGFPTAHKKAPVGGTGDDSPIGCDTNELQGAAESGRSKLGAQADQWPELQRLLDAWPNLPPTLRAGILQIVDSATAQAAQA